MKSFPYQTVDVFTDTRFGGNPLAVFTAANGLTDAQMQQLAAEMNYSETTFVLPPADAANTARVRIFNRTQEMPFAGHPNVGTGCVLAAMGRDRDGVLRFEETAGLVTVRVSRVQGAVRAADIDAPQPLSIGRALPADAVAACLGLAVNDVVTTRHPPRFASVGLVFCLVELTADALARAAPKVDAFHQLALAHGEVPDRLSLHCYVRGAGSVSGLSGQAIDTRMFAPISGTWEDPATGSANAALAAFLLSLESVQSTAFDIKQGIAMGRPSRLHATARRTPDGIRATIGGGCVPVLRGEAQIDD